MSTVLYRKYYTLISRPRYDEKFRLWFPMLVPLGMATSFIISSSKTLKSHSRQKKKR